jgi:hypothetical protein
MLTNAHILDINCKPPYSRAVRIMASTPVPVALTPTALQSKKPHLPYIDVLPFPSLRDKLLRASDIIDNPELWSDIIGGAVRVWGKTPWDKRGWEVEENFAVKWWWLMTDEVLEEANFWRVSRGEAPLCLKSIKQRFQSGANLNSLTGT